MNKIVQRCVVVVCASLLCQSVRAAEPLNEKSFEKLMEEVGKTAKRFKKNQDDKNSAQLTKDAARLAEIFKQTAGFWQNRKVSDAAKWSEESEASAKSASAAAKAEDWDKVKAHLGSLMKNCKTCHDAHREKKDDGGYSIK